MLPRCLDADRIRLFYDRVTGEIDLPTAHSKILILPIECFSPVPNKSLVNLARCGNYFNLYQSISPTSSAAVRHFDPLIPELRDYDYSLEAYRMKMQRYHNPDDFSKLNTPDILSRDHSNIL